MKKIEKTEHSSPMAVLVEMRKKVCSLIENYLVNNMEASGLELNKIGRLKRAFDFYCGDGHLLLSDNFPYKKRIKFNSYQQGEYFVKEINGADDYLLAYDCETQEVSIIDKPIA